MIIISADNERIINVGNGGILFSVYSTLEVLLGKFKGTIPLVEQFLKSGLCKPENALETARQFNLFRDELSKHPCEDAIYDMTDPKKKSPWEGNLSRVVTSCANLYTTADGQDLLFEIVKILCYANSANTCVCIQV